MANLKEDEFYKEGQLYGGREGAEISSEECALVTDTSLISEIRIPGDGAGLAGQSVSRTILRNLFAFLGMFSIFLLLIAPLLNYISTQPSTYINIIILYFSHVGSFLVLVSLVRKSDFICNVLSIKKPILLLVFMFVVLVIFDDVFAYSLKTRMPSGFVLRQWLILLASFLILSRDHHSKRKTFWTYVGYFLLFVLAFLYISLERVVFGGHRAIDIAISISLGTWIFMLGISVYAIYRKHDLRDELWDDFVRYGTLVSFFYAFISDNPVFWILILGILFATSVIKYRLKTKI